jgi:nicotinamide mononucleotide (NMN) deamidase PncC
LATNEQLIKAKLKIYLVVTGGGSGVIPRILTEGGASSFLVGAEVPYSGKAVFDFLGVSKIDKYCSEDVARQLAVKASDKCRRLADWPKAKLGQNSMYEYAKDEDCWGVSCSAALAKEGERKDRLNVAYIAAHGYRGTFSDTVKFSHDWDFREWKIVREEQENELASYIIMFLNNLLNIHD